MKRFLLLILTIGLLTGQADALTFSLSNAQSLSLSDTYSDTISLFFNTGLKEKGVGGQYPTDGEGMLGEVGYLGNLTDRNGDSFARVLWSYDPDVDLSSFDSYGMLVFNDDQSIWDAQLHLKAGGVEYTSLKVALTPGATETLAIDLTSIADADLTPTKISSIGYYFSSNFMGVGGNYPSGSDFYHMSVTPVPAPTAVVLGVLGLGIAAMKLRRRA